MTTIPFSLRNNIKFEDSASYNLEQFIFNKDFTELFHCPISIKDSYSTPNTVSTIGVEMFSNKLA